MDDDLSTSGHGGGLGIWMESFGFFFVVGVPAPCWTMVGLAKTYTIIHAFGVSDTRIAPSTFTAG